MYWLALTFSVACAASLGLTAAVRTLARQWGVLDYPDGRRKLHQGLVPLWGGIAVYLALVLGLVGAQFGSFGLGDDLDELAATVIAAAGLVCFFGCIDDACRLKPRVKLLLQVCAVLPVVMVGCRVDRVVLFGGTVELGWLGVPLTVLWLVGCINAMNLLDGMDGLASIVGLSTAVMMGTIAACIGNDYVAVIATALAGALAGFLVHNLPPASIFLGDSGSMVIGLVVGILGVKSTLKTSATLAITAPLVVMTFPIFDAFLAILRRKLTGKRFDAADREHIHHRLLDRGMSPWMVLGILGTLCLATGVAATVATVVRSDALAWITAATLVVLAVRLRLFGHHELAMVVRAVAHTAAAMIRRLGGPAPSRGQVDPSGLTGLSAADVWAVLIDRARPCNVRRLRLILGKGAEHSRERTWIDAGLDAFPAPWWAVGIAVPCREGTSCGLEAAGFDADGTELPDPAALVEILDAFGRHFADHPEQVEDLVRDGQEQPGSDWRRDDRRIAA